MGRVNVFALIKDFFLVGLAISVGILQDENPIAFRTLISMTAIVDYFTNPDATSMIDVGIGRAQKHGFSGEESDL